MRFEHRQLSNGLTIVGEISDSAQSAAIGFFIRTGSRDETAEVSGVSHFLEHMTFKGTERLSALEVNEAFDRTGAKFNAFTSHENTVYYAAVLPEYLEEVTDLWTDLMRPSLRDEDFTMEKNVILEEIAMYKDTPQFDVMDRCRSLHFGDHPCGNSVLGSEGSVGSMTADQMRAYHQTRYGPNNMVVACCGQVDFEAVRKLIEHRCGTWQPMNAPRPLSFDRGTGKQQRMTKTNLQREHICLISSSVAAQDKRRYAASLLSMVIGDDTGSRFFWSMVDTAIAETAAMEFESLDGVGAMDSYINCGPENAATVMDLISKTFRDLQDNGVKSEELEAARNKILSALTIKSEVPMGRLVDLGMNWIYLKEYASVSDEVREVRAVTLDDVNELVNEFPPSHFTCFSIGPDK
jgi:predicted Zn-dependent peptidase